ncbi:GNAT family N-acetyltransferase [Pseudonocardia sp. H11422]|uniref:GNAT family N-acetyltransferase n=1 Tax=Pseudonocardia sp. H11422 TaxID=2835866 RepID=UPI001BDDA459|nr:GNAT family N-acetyltransferase [Pseudonocardia sp. H11422]
MSTTDAATVRAMDAADTHVVSAVLAGTFADDPVFCWMIPDAARRERMLPGIFTLFARAYEPLGASHVVDGGTGAALWAPPGQQAFPDEEADEFAGRIEQIAGADTARIFEVVALLEGQHPHTPCYYLNLLGVDPALRGGGLGSALLAIALRRCDEEGQPAYLEATSPDNRRLYARHGFEVVSEIELPDGPSLWPMWRDPRA